MKTQPKLSFKINSDCQDKSYVTVPIGEFAEVKGGIGFPVELQGENTTEIPFFKVSDMELAGNERELLNANNYVSLKSLSENLKCNFFDKPAVVFAKVGAALLLDRKRICRSKFLIDNNMMAVMPNTDICKLEYLYYDLLNKKLSNLSNTGALPSINAYQIKEVAVKLPCIEEQQKIAEFFTALDEKIQLKVHKKAQLEYLYKSLLEKLYSTTIDRIPLSEVATFHSGLTYKPTDVSDSGVIVLRSSNIQNNHIDLTDKVFVDMNLSSELKINEGDILMCIRNGSKNLVGKTALIDSTCESYTWGAFMMVIRSKEQNNWVHHFLRSKKFRSQIDSDSNTATINQITKGMLNECLIPWPALETRVNSSKLLDLIERRIFITERMIFELNSLKKAFMQRMFV